MPPEKYWKQDTKQTWKSHPCVYSENIDNEYWCLFEYGWYAFQWVLLDTSYLGTKNSWVSSEWPTVLLSAPFPHPWEVQKLLFYYYNIAKYNVFIF